MARKKVIDASSLDFEADRAAQVLFFRARLTRLIMVGCGGTGSWLAPTLVRIARALADAKKEVEVIFVDHDHVKRGNIPRQHFFDPEIGKNKAIALASRYSYAWRAPIAGVPRPFDPEALTGVAHAENALNIVIGCVDNPKARRQISRCLNSNYPGSVPRWWWLDCGNSKDAGQILLGSAPSREFLEHSFESDRICYALPSPALVLPTLVKQAKVENVVQKKMSCLELMLRNDQSLAINLRVAAEATDFLSRILLPNNPLRRFASFFNFLSGTSEWYHCTPEKISSLLKYPIESLKAPGRRRIA